MATSGTVATLTVSNRQMVDHGFRRAGYVPQKISGEALAISLELLYSLLSEVASQGFPLWTRQYLLLPITAGSPDVQTPIGTVEVLHSYWRILQPYRGVATTSAAADASDLFGGAPSADITIAGLNAGVIVNFTTDTEIDTIGVLLGGSADNTAALQVKVSDDGITYTTAQTLPSTVFSPGEWSYFDLNPVLTSQYVKLVNPTATSWVLNQLNFGLANGQDIELGVQNIDDYFNLPNKQFKSQQPNTVFQDRMIENSVLKIWPAPNIGAFYNGTVTALTRRYIQNPGTLRDSLEIPRRWIEPIQWMLADKIINEIPDAVITPGEAEQMTYFKAQARKDRAMYIDGKAKEAKAIVWAEERTKGPIRLTPSISPYTR